MDRTLILRTSPSGESFLKLDVLGAETGAFLCLKRISKKNQQTAKPDLFDTADIQLESSKQGTAKFVREYALIQRRENIGNSYHSLKHASAFCTLIARNGPHMAEPIELFELTERTLDAIAAGKAAEVVHLKALYLLLKNEGYPVRESWWASLNQSWKALGRVAINDPAPNKNDPASSKIIESILLDLYRWLQGETDLVHT